MSKIVTFLSKTQKNSAAEARQVLEDAFAYYTPAEYAPTKNAPADAGLGQSGAQTVLGQMYGYYTAA